MARTTDRQHISEAVRQGTLWRVDSRGTDYVVLVTDYAERLWVRYGRADQVLHASYTHYGEDHKVASHEPIALKKRERILELIRQKDVNEH